MKLMGISPSSSLNALTVALLAAVVAGSPPVLAQAFDSEQNASLLIGRSRLQALKNWPHTTETPLAVEPSVGDASDAGLAQIEEVCSDARTEYPFCALVTDNFVLLHCGSNGWAASTGNLLERTYNRFYTAFQGAGFSLKQPEHRLTWVCFNNTDDYHRYAWQTERRDVSALEGYYSAQTNRVALYDTAPFSMPSAPVAGTVVAASASEPLGAAPQLLDAARTTHEAAHQLAFNSGLQRRGVMYPFWLSEGLATAFENDPAEASTASEAAARSRRLLDARAVNALTPLSHFVSMTRIPMEDMGQVYDAYAQAWGFFTFLLENHRNELNHYVARLQSAPQGRRSPERMRREFTDSFGELKPLEREWTQYLNSLERGS